MSSSRPSNDHCCMLLWHSRFGSSIRRPHKTDWQLVQKCRQSPNTWNLPHKMDWIISESICMGWIPTVRFLLSVLSRTGSTLYMCGSRKWKQAIMKNISNIKSTGVDDNPTRILKTNLYLSVNILNHIIKSRLIKQIVPNGWEIACLTPVNNERGRETHITIRMSLFGRQRVKSWRRSAGFWINIGYCRRPNLGWEITAPQRRVF